MRSQVSAELLIVIAALAALAVYVFNQMRGSAEKMKSHYENAQSKIEDTIDQLLND